MVDPIIESRRKGRSGTQSMLIPSREMVAAAVHKLPRGEITDPGEVRRALASEYGADACCPVTVQRHIIALSADNEAPFWRVVDPERAFARRVAGGPEGLRAKLAEEQKELPR